MRERRFTPAVLLLVLVALALLGVENCPTGPSSVSVLDPTEGEVVTTPVFPVTVGVENADETTLTVTLDGVDVSSSFTVGTSGPSSTATAALTAGSGRHFLDVSVQSSKGTHTDRRGFFLTPLPFFTPDHVALGLIPIPSTVTVRGTVTGISYEDHGSGPSPDRFVLLAMSETEGLSLQQKAWGLGARMTEQQWKVERIPLPYPGDVVEYTGTVAIETVEGHERFVLNDVTDVNAISRVEPLPLDLGQACTQDTECRDDLVCDRDTLTCDRLPAEIVWGGDPRGVNGACSTDADCPTGQVCDPGYAIPADGFYGAHFYHSRDAGRFLCQVPDRDAALATICPRIVTVEDVHGGRFWQGKEVCVRGKLKLSVFNPGDNDTHIQMNLDLDRVYAWPEGSPPVSLVGHAFENAPPYKDPSNPGYPNLPDPSGGIDFVALGTVKFDTSHNWFEVHPIKWWTEVTD